MRKVLKFLLLISICFLAIGLGNCVKANSIDSISMDIYIDKNGNAKVTEVWNCNVSDGTEVYHPTTI